MGLFDFLKSARQHMKHAQMLNGRRPIFSQFGTNIYASDVVQQACFCIVQEVKKLNMRHIRHMGSDVVPVSDRVQAVLDAPNAIMTQTEFLERFAWSLLLNYNSWIFAARDEAGRLTALWPLNPKKATFVEDASGHLFVTLEFKDGTETTVRYGVDAVNIKSHYFANDYMGGDESGQPDNAALLDTVELNDTLMQGVAKGLKASYAVNGVVKYSTMLDDGTMDANIKELSTRLNNNESGMLPLDIKGDYIPISKDIKLIDKDTLEFVDSKILRHMGVSLPILTRDYTTDQLAAFYQASIEPIVVSLAQGLTLLVFSAMERAHRNAIEIYPEELIFMSTAQKLELVRELGPSGTLFENEKRRIFGIAPLPELVGVRLMSLNYIDVKLAEQYQLNGAKNDSTGDEAVTDEPKKEDGQNEGQEESDPAAAGTA